MEKNAARTDERIAALQSRIIRHRRFEDIGTRVKTEILKPGGAEILEIYGPAGIGKSTLIRWLMMLLLKEDRPLLTEKRELIPFAYASARAPFGSTFDWKGLLSELLVSLNEPMMDGLMHHRTGPELDQGLRFRDAAKGRLLKQLQTAAKQRKPKALIIDEAHHLFLMPGAQRIQYQMEAIKDLAGLTEARLVLVGTYDLVNRENLSAQVIRRSREFHFSRYTDSPADRDEFGILLRTVEGILPCEADLLPIAQMLYTGSLGCFGLLMQWVARATDKALRNGRDRVTEADFRETALETERLSSMLDEMLRGEKQVVAAGEKPRTQRQAFHHLYSRLREPSNGKAERPTIEQPRRRPPKKARPGTRNPKRDPIGGGHHGLAGEDVRGSGDSSEEPVV